MRETQLYNRISPYLTKWGAISRVENTVESGMWDIHFCIDGIFGWIETKIEHSGKLYFERFQPAWGGRYYRAGATNLHVLAELGSDVMGLYHVSEIIKAPKIKERKWLTIQTKDLEPRLLMYKPYNWMSLHDVLVNS